jgi:predicted Zn-dependent protease
MDELRQQIEEDPGNPVFAELAEALRKQEQLAEALDVCLLGLSANPECHKGRLVLSQLFYQKGYYPFAIRELEQLHRALPENRSVRKLLEKLSPGSVGESGSAAAARDGSEQDTIAEADFDFDMLDLVDSDDDE